MGDHSLVVRLHSGNGEHAELDRRSEECLALALDDAGIRRRAAAVDADRVYDWGSR